MSVTVKLSRVPGMARRLRVATVIVLNTWSKEQVTRLKAAYSVGGHQQHGGSAWQPLKKVRATPLVRTGTMRNATSASVSKTEVELLNPTPYGHFHQEGTKTLAKREIIVVTSNDELKLRQMLKAGIEKGLK